MDMVGPGHGSIFNGSQDKPDNNETMKVRSLGSGLISWKQRIGYKKKFAAKLRSQHRSNRGGGKKRPGNGLITYLLHIWAMEGNNGRTLPQMASIAKKTWRHLPRCEKENYRNEGIEKMKSRTHHNN